MPNRSRRAETQRLDRRSVYLVTSAEHTSLCDDDQALAEALLSASIPTEVVVWTDPSVKWSRAAVCMVRSVWDYHLQPDRFQRWIKSVSAVTTLLNPAELMTWNMHKRYLRQLSAQGVPTIDTVWICPGTRVELTVVLSQRGWHQALVKPAVSASAWKTAKVAAGDAVGQLLVEEILLKTDVMVQPYLASIERDGEVSIIAIDGEITHAARRISALTGDIHVTRQGAPHVIAKDEQALATQVIKLLPAVPSYARIDLVRDDQDRLLLGELELIEPVLYLRHGPLAVQRLVHILANHLHGHQTAPSTLSPATPVTGTATSSEKP